MTVLDGVGALDQAIRRLEAAWLPKERPSRHREFFGYVPLPEAEFLAGMTVVREEIMRATGAFHQPTFLDVGCGIGTKLLVAEALGFWVTGIDRHVPYVAAARRLTSAPVEHADAFSFDRYAEFDVVYAYHPCADRELQQRFNAHVARQMRPGALFFLAGARLDYEPVADQVWRI